MASRLGQSAGDILILIMAVAIFFNAGVHITSRLLIQRHYSTKFEALISFFFLQRHLLWLEKGWVSYQGIILSNGLKFFTLFSWLLQIECRLIWEGRPECDTRVHAAGNDVFERGTQRPMPPVSNRSLGWSKTHR